MRPGLLVRGLWRRGCAWLAEELLPLVPTVKVAAELRRRAMEREVEFALPPSHWPRRKL